MPDRYSDSERDADVPSPGVSLPPELDEYICEFVDGTMDASVRSAFEDYLEANPNVARHVERIIETRDILQACADQCPCLDDDFQKRLKCAVENECVPEAESAVWLDRLTGVVLTTSAVTLLCLAVVAPRSVDEGFPSSVAATTATAAVRIGSSTEDPLRKVRYHRDRPAMVRIGPSTPVPPSYVGLGLQPTYRDVAVGASYLATYASP